MSMKREDRRVSAACALRDAAAAIVYSQARVALALATIATNENRARPARARAMAQAARTAIAMVRAATISDDAALELVAQAEQLVDGITGPPAEEKDLQAALCEIRRQLVELWGVEL